jgi:hypothetical protein
MQSFDFSPTSNKSTPTPSSIPSEVKTKDSSVSEETMLKEVKKGKQKRPAPLHPITADSGNTPPSPVAMWATNARERLAQIKEKKAQEKLQKQKKSPQQEKEKEKDYDPPRERPRSSVSFKRELKEAYQAKKLNKMASKQADLQLDFPRYGKSQNIVKKVPEEVFIPTALFQEEFKKKTNITLEDVKKTINRAVHDAGMSREQRKAVYHLMTSILEEFKTQTRKSFDKCPMAPTEKINLLLDILSDQIEENNPALYNCLGRHLLLLADQCTPLSFSQTPTRFQKEEIIRSLQMYANYAEEKKTNNPVEIYDESMIAISQLKEEYIDEKELKKLLANLPENQVERILASSTPYYSNYELLMHSSFPSAAAERLTELFTSQNISPQVFSIKEGLENIRELLGQSILQSLGLDDLYVHKMDRSTTMQATTIAGEWVQSDLRIYSALLRDVFNLHRKLLIASSEPNSDKRRILSLRTQLDRAESQYLKSIHVDPLDRQARAAFDLAVQTHATIDIGFWSQDSYRDQYKYNNINGVSIPYCFDFARFLPPSIACINRAGAPIILLRSFFLDFPQASRALAPELIDKIRSWVIEKLEQQYRKANLIGDPEKFSKASEELTLLFGDVDALNRIANQNISELSPLVQSYCEKFEIPIPPAGEYYPLRFVQQDLIDQIIRRIASRIENIRKDCFHQIHPDSFNAFKERLTAMQEYVNQPQFLNQTDSPTILGMLRHVSSDTAQFLDAMRNWELQPAEGLSVANIEGQIGLRPLESIIAAGIKTIQREEDTAAEPETPRVNPLENTLENLDTINRKLKNSSPSIFEAYLCMNI